jgi:hypothetical protein
LSHSPALFCEGCFWGRVSWTICLGWLWTMIFLISASWVARIIRMHHLHPVTLSTLCGMLYPMMSGLCTRPHLITATTQSLRYDCCPHLKRMRIREAN